MPQGKTKLVPGAAGGLGRTETKIQFLTFWQAQKIFARDYYALPTWQYQRGWDCALTLSD